ncbi:MAG: tRNA 2-selenouridine(34) synthase MnmH [Flavobacteriales bacterium]|nr:tRNA 2-selenouridine(34) synthase MnmH [Flavobacteriales bacterium]
MQPKPSEILFNGLPTLDVRSPGEFSQGRAPGAKSLSLFTDEERKRVGIAYKQKGRDKAVVIGLDIVGPKMSGFVQQALAFAPEKKVNMYCWRGGMRSGSMAWLLQTSGFNVNLIEGGYKAWRREVLEVLAHPYHFINLGGLTGVGKTDVLLELQAQGEQIIDLEAAARHTGSAFNSYEEAQPSSEQFENELAEQLLKFDATRPIWIEDESRNIGKVVMNQALYDSKRTAPFVLVNRPKEERVVHLCKLYGSVPLEMLKDSFKKIERRLGGQYLQAAIEYLEDGNLPPAARIALQYYDKAYMYSMAKHDRKPIFSLSLKEKSPAEGATALIEWNKSTKVLHV